MSASDVGLLSANHLALEIRAEHQAAQDAAASAVVHAIRAGELLLQAKAQLPHGAFGTWIRERCEFSDRTARGYMRLAGLDEAKRQRVADLSLRRALAEIAEPAAPKPDTEAPPGKGARFDELMAWAQQQVGAPINEFDLDSWECMRNKLHAQIGLSSEISVLLGMHSKEFPMVRLANADQLLTALTTLATLIKDDAEAASIDISPRLPIPRMLELWTMIKLCAQRDFGLIWHELTSERKRYERKDGHDLWQQDCKALCEAFVADCDAKIAGLPCSDELIPGDGEMVCGTSGDRTLQIANSAAHPGYCFVAVITNFGSGDAVVDSSKKPIKKSAIRECVMACGFQLASAHIERKPSGPWPNNIWLAEEPA
jgi:hypothetical protein